MTCLTITPDSVSEAVDKNADLIVAHHPLPFKPLKKITGDSVPGQLLLRLIENKIAVFSHHTAFDSAATGSISYWQMHWVCRMLNRSWPAKTQSILWMRWDQDVMASCRLRRR